jgi:hypothetical protein
VLAFFRFRPDSDPDGKHKTKMDPAFPRENLTGGLKVYYSSGALEVKKVRG